MDKLDKVLEGLDCCTSLNFNLCDNGTCPYGPWNVTLLCKHRLMRDAKELLKEYKQLQAWTQGHGLTTCKNCRHGEPYPEGDGEIYGVVCDGCWHDDNWFCADGDPKEDNLYA